MGSWVINNRPGDGWRHRALAGFCAVLLGTVAPLAAHAFSDGVACAPLQESSSEDVVSPPADTLGVPGLPQALKDALAAAPGIEPVKVAYVDFPPYTHTVKGQAAGAFIELARAVLDDLGLQYEFIEMPVARIYSEMGNGGTHMWLGAPGAPSMEGKIITGTTDIGSIRLNLYGLSGDKPPTLLELRNTSLITIQGYVYGGRINQLKTLVGVRLLPTASHRTAFLMLKSGRAPYVLGYHMPVSLILPGIGINGLEVTNVVSTPSKVNLSLRAPHPHLLLEAVENALLRALPAHKKALEAHGNTTAYAKDR